MTRWEMFQKAFGYAMIGFFILVLLSLIVPWILFQFADYNKEFAEFLKDILT